VTATDLDPFVMLIVRLLAPSSVTGDRIVLTNETSLQDGVGALFRPITPELARRGREWDKNDSSSSGLCFGVGLPKI
jgi:hypothetical protein